MPIIDHIINFLLDLIKGTNNLVKHIGHLNFIKVNFIFRLLKEKWLRNTYKNNLKKVTPKTPNQVEKDTLNLHKVQEGDLNLV